MCSCRCPELSWTQPQPASSRWTCCVEGEWGWIGCLHRTLPTSATHLFSDSGQGHFPSEVTVIPEGLKALRDVMGGLSEKGQTTKEVCRKGVEKVLDGGCSPSVSRDPDPVIEAWAFHCSFWLKPVFKRTCLGVTLPLAPAPGLTLVPTHQH